MKTFFMLLVGLISPLAFANVEIQQFDNPQQENLYRELIQELRCPQCQNNNIADSNATIATDMRNKTLELLKQGKKKEEVINYMVERYGNFVTYNPPLTPATLLLWLIPFALVLGGGAIIWRKQKQAVRSTSTFANSASEQQRLDQILNHKDTQ